MADILMAEDEQEFAELVRSYLTNAGHTVRIVGEGLRVTAELNIRLPDIILLDIQMPAGKGTDVLKRIKANPAWADIPVVMLSCLSEQDARAAGYAGGACAYLTKPIPLNQLLEVIEDAQDYSGVFVQEPL